MFTIRSFRSKELLLQNYVGLNSNVGGGLQGGAAAAAAAAAGGGGGGAAAGEAAAKVFGP